MLKNFLKNFYQTIGSRLFYLILGLFFALSVTIIYAASTVSSGQTLTASLWNDLVSEINTLNSKIDNWPPGNYCILANGGCPSGFSAGELHLLVGAASHDQCDGLNQCIGSSCCGSAWAPSIKRQVLSFCCK